MKKVKRILAMLMAMAMVLGMAVTASAEGMSATIKVHNASAAIITQVQIIQPNVEKETGWEFINGGYESFVKIYAGLTDQEIIKAMQENLTDGRIAQALEQYHTDNGAKYTSANVTDNTSTATKDITVTSAGVYAIHGVETGFTYNEMAAYVSFDKYDPATGVPTALKDADVYAKKKDDTIEKSTTDNNLATGISETVDFTVNTTVPYGVSEWKLTDKISGAAYVTETESANAGKVKVSVKIGAADPIDRYATVGENSFTLDLTDIATVEANVGAPVVLTYQAVVTGKIVGNTIESGDGNNKSEEVKLYTGSITLQKLGEKMDASGADDATNRPTLAGAGFKISRKVMVNGAEVEQWATFDDNKVLTGWVEDIEQATEVFTEGDDGEVTVSGLDAGTYHFKETTAPEGYSINEDGKDVELTLGEGVQQATAEFSVDSSMTDTKLAALPATGGIGTYIFTIAGIIIMAAAAGFFFVSRRKANR